MPKLRIQKDELDSYYRLSEDPSKPGYVDVTEAEYDRIQSIFTAFWNLQEKLRGIVSKTG